MSISLTASPHAHNRAVVERGGAPGKGVHRLFNSGGGGFRSFLLVRLNDLPQTIHAKLLQLFAHCFCDAVGV